MGDPAPAQPTNGTARAAAAAAAALVPAEGPVAKAQARIRAGRASTLAALESGGDDPAVEARTTPAKQEPAPQLDAPPQRPRSLPPAETDDDETPEPEVKADPPAATEQDPETGKRLATVQAAEKRSRDKIAKERAELAKERETIERERTAAAKERADFDAWKKKLERAKVDPIAYLEAGGVDDFEYAARMAWAKTKAPTDPASKEAAAREMRTREHETELQRVTRELDELKSTLTAKDQQQQFESHRHAYLEHAIKAVNDETPIAKALSAKNPAKLRAALWATTERLIAENDGDVPDFDEVVSAYETQRQAELDELGISVESLTAAAAAPTTKQNNQPADKKHPAKTLGNDLSTPRVPRPNKSGKEHRAETLAMLESGKLE